MHDHRFMSVAVFRIINDGCQLVSRNKKNIPFLKNISSIRLNYLCFAGDKPYQHMIIKQDIRFEKLIIVTRELNILSNVQCSVFHTYSFNYNRYNPYITNTIITQSINIEHNTGQFFTQFPKTFGIGFIQ